MRITNAMMRNNSLWSLNKNEELMNRYSTQLSTGKKIQKPSENPIVAVRALKFRTNIAEIKQYKTNSEDAVSWLSVDEQALKNSTELLKRAKDICVQGVSDIYSTEDREDIINELNQIKIQLLNEGNVNYAGRHIFTGYKTDTPLIFEKDSTDSYDIREHFTKNSIEIKEVPIDTPSLKTIDQVYRIRLGYSGVTSPSLTSTVAPFGAIPFTVASVSSTDPNAYAPAAAGTINFVEDTGELIFHKDNVNVVAPAIAIPDFNISYTKNNFKKGDLVPENYFDCTNTTTGAIFTKPNEEILYQISYNQDIVINSMGNQIFTSDMMRDFEEMLSAVRNIKTDGSIAQDLQEDILGNMFSAMLSKIDDHLNTVVREQSVVGSKVNRLELTINRLDDDKINFTELMSNNEDVDMTEAVMNLQAQEIVYQASMASSARLLQQSLLDFIR